MNIKKLNEELYKLINEDTDEDIEKLENIVEYIDSKLTNPQYPLLNLSVDNFESNWIIADYDIDNDLHNTYNHDDLIKDLRELDKKVRIFDEITDLGDGILELYLSIGPETSYKDIDKTIEGMEQIPAIIRKYYVG